MVWSQQSSLKMHTLQVVGRRAFWTRGERTVLGLRMRVRLKIRAHTSTPEGNVKLLKSNVQST